MDLRRARAPTLQTCNVALRACSGGHEFTAAAGLARAVLRTRDMSRAVMPSDTLAAVASFTALVSRHPHVATLLGLVLGMGDYLLLRALGVTMTLGERDATLAICVVFAVNFAGLGWAIGRLFAAQAAVRASAAQVADSQRRAAQSEKLAEIGQLAAGVAHEVRNPLGVIRSSAAMLALDLPEGGDARRASGFIIEEVDRLNGVVRALLDYARPLATHREALPFSALIEAVQPRIVDRLTDHSVTLTTRGAGTLTGDPDLLIQVLLTLLENAVQATPGGHIEVTMMDDELRVADDGPGVDPEVLARIFAPFVTTRAGGTGLGLAMAARIAEAHGGTLSLRPGAGLGPGGRGACFVLALPGGAA